MELELDPRFTTLVGSALKGVDPAGLTPQTSLAESGLDSIATIDLLVRLEAAYQVELPDELLTTETFATPASLWSVISGLRAP